MRISTQEFLLGSLNDLLAQESNANQLNQEIATGQTMLDATSDPAGAGLAVEVAGQINHLSYDANNAQSGAESIQNGLGVLQQVATLARIVSANSTAALAFRDEQDAQEVLGTLRTEPSVTAAAPGRKGSPIAARPSTSRCPVLRFIR